jgi:hypothetical protein
MILPITLKMPQLNGFRKRPQGFFKKTKVYVVFLILSVVFKTVLESFQHLWFVLNLKTFKSVPKDFTLIPCSEKASWSFKASFWKKNCPTKAKTVMKIFQAKGFPWFWDFLLRYAKTMKFRD